jgi:uncharacterized protein (DUF1800 family)
MTFSPHVFGLSLLALSAPLAALAIIDRDANQLSDIWQQRFLTGNITASLDSDGDGFTNLQESILGTNPFDAASRISTTLSVPAASSLATTWPSEIGKRYQFETSPDLVTWTLAATLDGTGAPLTFTSNTTATPRLFTRVKAADVDSDGDLLSDWEELAIGFDPIRMFTEGLGSNPTTPTTNNPRITDFERVRDLLAGTAAHTITIAAADPAMAENWPDPGVVVIRRTGRLTPVTVTFTLGGTATAGSDYAAPAFLTATIPLGADEVSVNFTPLADALTEGNETITVTLQPGAGYTLGAQTTATLTIADSADGLPSEKAAARFLQQATFGPAPDELARVRALGFTAWIDAQLARPVNLHLPLVRQWQAELPVAVGDRAVDSRVSSEHRIEAFWRQTMRTDPDSDPLRQRVAFALTQIFVVSDRNSSVADDQRGPADYYDVMLRNAFGSYRTLLEDVTRHPNMGQFLSSLRNRKANPAIGRFPDENYAREVLQLFSIGLWLLDRDGTQILSNGTTLGPDGETIPAGQPIPTYGQSQIETLARVFTGLSIGSRFANPDLEPTDDNIVPTTTFYDSRSVYFRPMRFYDGEHDLAAKSLSLPGHATLTLPARTGTTTTSQTAGNADLTETLDWLAAHPNIAPFICRQLIQRLVTSNPTPDYVRDVVAVFENSTYPAAGGTRGQLGAVVKKILTHDEARLYARTLVPEHGLVREPYTRFVAFARALSAAPEDPASSGGRYRGFGGIDGEFLQRPLSAPSVFNFYSPQFRPLGPLSEAGLVAPEMQIVNSATAITSPDRYSSALTVTNVGSTSGTGITAAPLTRLNSSTSLTDTAGQPTWNTRIDETPWIALAKTSPEALVTELDRRLCAGRMSSATFRAITRAVSRLEDPAGTANPLHSDNRARLRFRVAAHLAAISTESAVLR